MTEFDKCLQMFKMQEGIAAATAVLDDEELRIGVAAWSTMPVKMKPDIDSDAKPDTNNIHEQWAWLWEQVSFDIALFGLVAGVEKHRAVALFTRLMTLRLIYPDGEISSLAAAYMGQYARKKVGLKDRPPEKKNNKKKGQGD